jgi:Ca2+-transporting ATPase
LLWINIIMDGPPAMTLGIEPARPGLMQADPRTPGAQILTGERLFRLTLYGATMMVGTLAVFTTALDTGDRAHAVTLAFTTFVFFQFFNVFNARAEYGSAFNVNFLRNGKLWLALLGVLALQVVVVYWPPAQAIFATAPLALSDWGLAAAVASSVLVLDEARKLVWRTAGWGQDQKA